MIAGVRTGAASLLAAAAFAAAPGAEPPPAVAPVVAVLELRDNFFYAGDPFEVRLNITNRGDVEVDNPVRSRLLEGLKVRPVGGEEIKPTGKPKASEPSRPAKLGAKGFYGTVFDLTEMYPELKKPGRYELRWSASGVDSNEIRVSIIPRYDPTRVYRARFETDEGNFVVEFLGKSAPLASKAFVDLAHSGFYDGQVFHEARPDLMIAGGDPTGTGAGGAPFAYPQETPSIPVVAGSVLMKPSGFAPPSNSSQFFILLQAEPSMTGQLTVVGQVVEGLEIVRKISRVPTTQQATRPYFKPLQDVRIRKVSVEMQPSVTGP
ncbi:MAG TPA: peptidylprolyl isomerase [Candidatus Polarisedimenticolaceae bacterium]